MNKKNAGYEKNLKRLMSFMMSVLFAFSLLAGSACNNAKTINDYPEPVTVTAPSDAENNEGNTAENDTKPAEKEEETLDEALLPEYDSLREKGVFEFNPTAVNPVFKMEMKNKPKIVRVAKEILEAVHDAKPSCELTGDLACNEAEMKLARSLAELSSPVCYCVDISTEDMETYTISYFPSYESDQFGDETMTGAISEEEAKEKIDAYKELCENLINETLTDKDDECELGY